MSSKTFPFSLRSLVAIFTIVGIGAAAFAYVYSGDKPQDLTARPAKDISQTAPYAQVTVGAKSGMQKAAPEPEPQPEPASEPAATADTTEAQPEPDGEAAEVAIIQEEAAIPSPQPQQVAAPEQVYVPAPEKNSLKPPFRASLDVGLEPLFDYDISARDLENVKEAVRLVYKDDFTTARALMPKISDPAARKLVHWYILRASGVDTPYVEIVKFRQENPLWPSRASLDASIEAGLLFREANPEKVIAYFKPKPPETGAGKAALGGALLAIGDEDRGKSLIREAWRRHLFDTDIETRVTSRFGQHLTDEDNKSRLYWLMAKEPKKRAASIQKLRKALQEDVPIPEGVKDKGAQSAKVAPAKSPSKGAQTAQNKAKAKAVKTVAQAKAQKNAKTADVGDKKPGGTKAADAKTAEAAAKPAPRKKSFAVGREAKQDASQILVRVKEFRKKSQWKDAWSLLRSVPRGAVGTLEGPDWWEERRIHVRYALNTGYPKTAYDIAQNHGLLTAEFLSEAEFLAGWLALRHLGQPQAARDHFAVASAAGGLPKDKARAHYWLGRAETELKRKDEAVAAYREASRHHHTFYGQLSRHVLGPDLPPIEFREPYAPSAAEIKQFAETDIARAIAIASKAELNTIIPVFLFDLARGVEDPAQMSMVAEMSLRLASLPITVRFAKIAINRGFAVEHYAFPASLPAPEQQWKDKMVETSLLHALTRQESEFNPGIVSPVGARGLMQLMPATARMVARDLSVKYDPKKLDDPAFNVMLGGTFLQQMVDAHNGSYIMALAAYNAGPGRVRQWIGQFGDPRKANVDPIDWIERIPFTETRDYVHKIMESLQLYRAKFERAGVRKHLAQDVGRGRAGAKFDVMQAGSAN
ncbi:MAG: transglycosylase SLT domain-containing protein [Hyphomicrobiales bacterium]|nr:transglycosylase SLT domain-containing protein [Hyphomicrobiales bacterium]